MKSSNGKTQRDRGHRAKKRINQSPQIATPEATELPEPPVLPDVYTKDRRSIHPTRKQQPKPMSAKGDDGQK